MQLFSAHGAIMPVLSWHIVWKKTEENVQETRGDELFQAFRKRDLVTILGLKVFVKETSSLLLLTSVCETYR